MLTSKSISVVLLVYVTLFMRRHARHSRSRCQVSMILLQKRNHFRKDPWVQCREEQYTCNNYSGLYIIFSFWKSFTDGNGRQSCDATRSAANCSKRTCHNWMTLATSLPGLTCAVHLSASMRVQVMYDTHGFVELVLFAQRKFLHRCLAGFSSLASFFPFTRLKLRCWNSNPFFQ